MRVLMVGGGRPGLELTRRLAADGHAVRFVTRNEAFVPEIEAAGGEAYIGDPDRIGSLRYALDNVTILLWLLGRAPDGDLHGSRLTMMMERTIDTTVRGVIYEGTEAGAAEVVRMAGYNEIPYAILDVARDDPEAWADAILEQIDGVLAAPRG
ncbi:NAD(P)H-binding protein [Baekduia sp. Peel2402]|uniref:NAD(P)H-binding protein n=1 Tax=Baekduia sp. Peel2402 TaxID=3458296 RepID=UPI00403EA4A4